MIRVRGTAFPRRLPGHRGRNSDRLRGSPIASPMPPKRSEGLPIPALGPGGDRLPAHKFDAAAFAAGRKACNPRILGMGADSGHHEHRSPSTSVGTYARG
jgi:hypothetical protein